MPAESIADPQSPSLLDNGTSPGRRLLCIVRHGQRADNVDPTWRACGAPPRGHWDDPPLSPRGVAQASESGLALRSAPFGVLFCSPFTRCLQTAQQILRARGRQEPGLRVCIEPGFCESLSVCQQPRPGCPGMDEIRKSFPELPIDPDYRPFVGFDELAANRELTDFCCSRRVIGTLRHVLGTNRTENVLIVSHGSPILACHFALSAGELNYPGHCSISKYQIGQDRQKDDGQGWEWKRTGGEVAIPWRMGKSVVVIGEKDGEAKEEEGRKTKKEGDEQKKTKTEGRKSVKYSLRTAMAQLDTVAAELSPIAGAECMSVADATHLSAKHEDLHDLLVLFS